MFHPLNAYDLPDGRIVMDVARHPKMFATDVNGPFEGPPTLDRWTIDPAAGKVLEERLDDRGQEFPRVDERLVGRPHRYGYCASFGQTAIEHGALLKHDLERGSTRGPRLRRRARVRRGGVRAALGRRRRGRRLGDVARLRRRARTAATW